MCFSVQCRQLNVVVDFIGWLKLSRRTCGKSLLQRRKSTPPPPPNKTKNKTKEEEPCGKLLKKTPARKYPVFKPARSPGFQIGARTYITDHAGRMHPSGFSINESWRKTCACGTGFIIGECCGNPTKQFNIQMLTDVQAV